MSPTKKQKEKEKYQTEEIKNAPKRKIRKFDEKGFNKRLENFSRWEQKRKEKIKKLQEKKKEKEIEKFNEKNIHHNKRIPKEKVSSIVQFSSFNQIKWKLLRQNYFLKRIEQLIIFFKVELIINYLSQFFKNNH